MLGLLCELYNAALQECIECYRKTGRTPTYNTQALQLKGGRSIDERLSGFSFTAKQQVLRPLDKALRAFYERCKRGDQPGLPRYQAKRRFDSAEMRLGDGLAIKQEKLRILGIDGLVNVRWHRRIPEGAILGHAVLSRRERRTLEHLLERADAGCAHCATRVLRCRHRRWHLQLDRHLERTDRREPAVDARCGCQTAQAATIALPQDPILARLQEGDGRTEAPLRQDRGAAQRFPHTN